MLESFCDIRNATYAIYNTRGGEFELSVFFGLLTVYSAYRIILNRKFNFLILYKNLFLIYLAVSVMINVGYAIKLGNTIIAYNTVLSSVLMIVSLFLILQGRFNRKILITGILFWVLILVGLVAFSLFPYTGGMIQNIVEWDSYIRGDGYLTYSPHLPSELFHFLLAAFRFPIILSVGANVFNGEDIKKFVYRIYHLAPIVVAYGIFEVIAKKIFHSEITTIFINMLFGNAGIVYDADRLTGFTKETSQYAVVLFVFCMLTIICFRFGYFKKERVFWKNLLLLFCLMIVSGSLSAYYLLIISLLCVLITCNASNKIVIVVLCVLCGFIILLIGLPESVIERLGRVTSVFDAIFSKYTYQSYATSEGARLVSIYQMIKCCIARPICGVGLAVTDAHSTFFALLGNLGIVGVFFYYRIWYSFAKVKTAENKKFFFLIIASTFLVGGIGYFSDIYLPFIILCYTNSSKGRQYCENYNY